MSKFLILVVATHFCLAASTAQTTSTHLSPPETSSTKSSTQVPRSNSLTQSNPNLIFNLHKTPTNSACSGPTQNNPCGAMKKRRTKPMQPILAKDPLLTPTNLAASKTPLDRSELDPLVKTPFSFSPQYQEVTVVSIKGIETGIRNPTSKPSPRVAISAADADTTTITGYTPDFGNPGTVVTINGTRFGPPQVNSFVQVYSTTTQTYFQWAATIWTDSQIVATIPANMPIGVSNLYVVVNGVKFGGGTNPFEVGIPPAITSYFPTSGPVGTHITINGSGFGLPTSTSFVKVSPTIPTASSLTVWPATSWMDTKIDLDVPQGFPNQNVYITVIVNALETIGTYPFEVGIPPVITSYSPVSGPVGTHITINGTGFGQPASTSFVIVGPTIPTASALTVWPATSWMDTRIDLDVPQGFPSQNVYISVAVNGLESIGTYPFEVGIPPVVDCYNPTFGVPGTVLTINGSGFGAAQGTSYVSVLSRLTNDWTVWPVLTWSDTQITVEVPPNMPLSDVYFSVFVKGLASIGTFPFSVGLPPTISNYSPGFGSPGTQITIQGAGFGQVQGSNYVLSLSSVTNEFMSLPVNSWADTQIVVTIPSTTPLGKIYLSVYVAPLWTLGTYPFTVGIPPTITSYSPVSGPSSTVITINGSGFGSSQGTSSVTLLSATNIHTNLPVISWSDELITVSVPKLTPICLSYLYLTVDGLDSIGTNPFQVTPN